VGLSSKSNAYLRPVMLQRGEYGTFANTDAKVVLDSWKDSTDEKELVYSCWNATTARLAESATLAFLFLQLPQIILNTKNLYAGDFAALFAVPWMVSSLTNSESFRSDKSCYLSCFVAFLLTWAEMCFFFFFCRDN
jgi:hypothetical protein